VLFHELSEPEWSDSPSLNASSASRSPEDSPWSEEEEDDRRKAKRSRWRRSSGRKYMVAMVSGLWCAI
jgi:hypothetical protein